MWRRCVVWKIEFSEFSLKQIKKLDKPVAKKILHFLKTRVMSAKDPRSLAKPLLHDKSELWRYRVGDYRVICKIEDKELIVLVLRLGHRKDIYD